jgi:HPt (histidine-containing phosphotransfer) domain-containing protein
VSDALLDVNVVRQLVTLGDDTGDPAFFSTLVEEFVTQGQGWITTAERALASGEFVEARHCAHGLKGSSATIGAVRASLLARDLEDAARDEDLSRAAEIQTLLQQAFDDSARALRSFGGAAMVE